MKKNQEENSTIAFTFKVEVDFAPSGRQRVDKKSLAERQSGKTWTLVLSIRKIHFILSIPTNQITTYFSS